MATVNTVNTNIDTVDTAYNVRRVFVEKRPEYDVHSAGLLADLRDNLGISGLDGVRTLNRYDMEGLTDGYYAAARDSIFAELPVDFVYDEEMPLGAGERVFAVEYLPGQYDQRADGAAQCVQLLTHAAPPRIASARVVVVKGDIDEDDFQRLKNYCINPVDSREASLDKPASLVPRAESPPDVAVLHGFVGLDDDGIDNVRKNLGLAMKGEDLLFCRQYFRDTEKRDPTITEVRVLDTYWSDHCRHTTFLTAIEGVEIEDTALNGPICTAFETYMRAREYVCGDGADARDISLMDIALMGMRELRRKGLLNDLDASDEVNACSIVVPAVVDGKAEDWLVMFKNETHNHPTEIEPLGGAATCLGGAIRDPLSGRAYVYQAMRVTGAGDPRAAVGETLPGKLPQRKITTLAAQGYSSYGNQIGIATGIVSEVYHKGYIAKRMEIGAVVGAVPKSHVARREPEAGDIVVLLGGRTGRDGCGGATGSSKEHTEESIRTCGAEVQKGNAPTERKIQRLFRDPEVGRMIRRCNDFGAGGVAVAVGELAAGVDICLDAVPKKYEGLDGTELAISESQERMAVVINPADLKTFQAKAEGENLETAAVATVTDARRLKMFWRGKAIVDISRDFIDTNGVLQRAEVFVESPEALYLPDILSMTAKCRDEYGDVAGAFLDTMTDINACGQRGLKEMFDGSIGAGSVLMPFGGRYQRTPAEAMVAKLPAASGATVTGTAMSYGFDPYLASWSPFHGAVYAVIQSVAKIVAAGGDHRGVRLTLQEYFEKLGRDKTSWGKPFAALLGAYYAQVKLGIPAIGGKDSMSGTFKDLHVPPTLVSFALAPVDVTKVISPEFKRVGSVVVFVSIWVDQVGMPDFDVINRCYSAVHKGIVDGRILAVHTVGRGGISEAVAKMCFGNRVGFRIDEGVNPAELFKPDYAGLVVELDKSVDTDRNVLGIGENCTILGVTIEAREIVCRNVLINIDELYEKWEGVLEGVFPVRADTDSVNINDGHCGERSDEAIHPGDINTNGIDTNNNTSLKKAALKVAKPCVLIPVFPGTNCEYDSARKFVKAGAECDFFVFKNINPGDIDESVKIISEKITASQILMLPGGFSAGDEPDGSGKFIAAFFRNPRVKDAVSEFLNNRDGLMLGICNGFQALIKLGLVPYGEIRGLKEDSPTLTFNTIGRHISRIVYTKVRSVNSPWLINVKVGDVHAVPVSHGEGRFVAPIEEIKKLFTNGQVAAQYVNCDGEFSESMDGNCNGSYAAIEGILSPDGRVFGKMGHSERIGWENVAKNIHINNDPKIFEAGVAYFQ
ncbi:MAG: phosphoribosylformylglycinamidine synthase [Chitinispirillales bacterium]|jgi:phosphoribosylformylglycinamidine synthase|nr:phosphoribosylformylglycinamidine synthase [Chitinispirillales bacterium]